MHPDILTVEQTSLLPLVKQFSDSFGLVGGTAIALHLGHRRSVDFDLFSLKPFSVAEVRSRILRTHKIDHTFIQGENELTILVDKVKMTFYYFPYPVVLSQYMQDIIQLPDLETLAAMKAFALGKRAKWKDYVDLYFLIKTLNLATILKVAKNTFGTEFNEKLFRVQLGYFKDIDYSEEVEFMPDFETSEDTIKSFLTDQSLL